MNILVIGGGGREHALVDTFHRQGHEVWCTPGNGGILEHAKPFPCPPNSYKELAEKAKEFEIDLTVVGPEVPLAEGIVDIFEKHGLTIFGPNKKAAKLESSKSWAKNFMKRHKIPTAHYEICKNAKSATQVATEYLDQKGRVVIKASGLAAGKGVFCCESQDEAEEAIHAIFDEELFGKSGSEVVIEETLRGKEVSLLAFCDGKVIKPMLASQDHKRLLDGGLGPNTGGLGAYAPPPFVTETLMQEIQETIIQPTCQGLIKDKVSFNGVVYFGLMLTQQGPKVLEYNCRFGDPEAQAVLPLIESDLAEVMLACCRGELEKTDLQWKKGAACCVVICSGGYPLSYETGYPITGLEMLRNRKNVTCFHAGTAIDQEERLVTKGGRVLGVTGIGDTLEAAIESAYLGVQEVDFEGMHYREDIGYQAVGELTETIICTT